MPLWASSESGDAIIRSFVSTNFVTAMAFLNEVATVAEEQGHHPDLHLTQYRNVEIRLQTFSMGGALNTRIAYCCTRFSFGMSTRHPGGVAN